MLNKLLKYDLKYMVKNMSIFYILALFFAVLSRIFFELDQSVIIKIISSITIGCMWAMVANILINTVMRSWVRFRESLYKDEAYLTHTLPVTKSQIYDSKFIQALIFFVVGFVIILLCLFIAFYSNDNWEVLTRYIKNITLGLNMSTFFFIAVVFILIFLELFNAIQCGFYGMIIGHKFNNAKLGYSVLFGFILYLVAQSLVLALTFIYGLFDSSIMDLFKTSTQVIDAESFKLLGILASILYVVIIFIMSILCKKSLNKGVNVE